MTLKKGGKMKTKNDLLQKFFEENKITQSDFGKKIDVTQGLVGQWLRGERPVSVVKSLAIEAVFNIDAAKLSNDVFLVRNAKRVRFQK